MPPAVEEEEEFVLEISLGGHINVKWKISQPLIERRVEALTKNLTLFLPSVSYAFEHLLRSEDKLNPPQSNFTCVSVAKSASFPIVHSLSKENRVGKTWISYESQSEFVLQNLSDLLYTYFFEPQLPPARQGKTDTVAKNSLYLEVECTLSTPAGLEQGFLTSQELPANLPPAGHRRQLRSTCLLSPPAGKEDSSTRLSCHKRPTMALKSDKMQLFTNGFHWCSCAPD